MEEIEKRIMNIFAGLSLLLVTIAHLVTLSPIYSFFIFLIGVFIFIVIQRKISVIKKAKLLE